MTNTDSTKPVVNFCEKMVERYRELLTRDMVGKLPDVIKRLQELEKECSWDNPTIEVDGYYGDLNFYLVGQSLETDEECQERLEQERKELETLEKEYVKAVARVNRLKSKIEERK